MRVLDGTRRREEGRKRLPKQFHLGNIPAAKRQVDLRHGGAFSSRDAPILRSGYEARRLSYFGTLGEFHIVRVQMS